MQRKSSDCGSTPIIVYEPGDPMIFESVTSAEWYLEPVDVKNDEYVSYNSEGRLLRLSTTSFRVTIETAENQPTHVSEVREILAELLANQQIAEDWLSRASLQNALRGIDIPNPSANLWETPVNGMDQTVGNGGRLRFNLDGVNVEGAFDPNSAVYNTYTSRELRYVLRAHPNATSFYLRGSRIPPPQGPR